MTDVLSPGNITSGRIPTSTLAKTSFKKCKGYQKICKMSICSKPWHEPLRQEYCSKCTGKIHQEEADEISRVRNNSSDITLQDESTMAQI